MIWYDVVWYDVGVVCSGCDRVWCGILVWYGVLCGVMWYGMVWVWVMGMIWYSMQNLSVPDGELYSLTRSQVLVLSMFCYEHILMFF